MNHIDSIILSRHLLIEPNAECPWAHEMVLNPAIVRNPQTGVIHMLFRATGAYEHLKLEGCPAPFPIFLGHAWSNDDGISWEVNFREPALSPKLAVEYDELLVKNRFGEEELYFANGCVEDPRLFFLEDSCYTILACRLFSPGPYWVHDDPTQCLPSWVRSNPEKLGRAGRENITVNLLFEVDLDALEAKRYSDAFHYVCKLTDPEKGENRDVILFPRKLVIDGVQKYVCIHRPWQALNYKNFTQDILPSIAICANEDLSQIWKEEDSQEILAQPLFDWEACRVGASANVLELEPGEWLLSYHGKKDSEFGYTQSFMILQEQENGLPQVKHRCSERILFPVESWEQPNRFKAPVVFITGMLELNRELLVSYGAADERVGLARLDLPKLVELVRSYDAVGRRVESNGLQLAS